MPTTPTYGWPYQALTDPPDGPNLGEDLALAIEATVAALATTVNANAAAVTANTAAIALINGRAVYRARQTVVQAIPDATYTGVTFTTEDFDTANGHDTATNPERYTFPRTSYYLLSGSTAYANSATNQRGNRWNVNGTAVNGSATLVPSVTGNVCVIDAVTLIVAGIAGQYCKLEAYQNAGAPLNTFVTSENSSSITVVELRP
jgi:hypothetical protein